MSCADIWISHPTGASPMERRGAVQEMVIRHSKEDEEWLPHFSIVFILKYLKLHLIPLLCTRDMIAAYFG